MTEAKIDNSLDDLLINLGLENVPKVWYENWDSSMELYTDNPMYFITDEYLRYSNITFKLNGKIMEAFFQSVAIIRDSSSLCQLTFLWHYIVFLGGENVDDLDFSKWPVPVDTMGSHVGMLYAIIIVSGLPRIKQFYRDRSIPDSILLDTLSDLEINMEEYKAKFGVYGLDDLRMGWMLNHIRGTLFRLGRLQFIHRFYDEGYKVFRNDYSNKVIALCESGMEIGENGHMIGNPITSMGHLLESKVELSEQGWDLKLSKGDAVLETHIPRGERMTYSLCIDSFNKAVLFFSEFFRENEFKAFTCHSWLLSPSLGMLLPEDSNIIKFQKLYYLTSIYRDDSIFEYVFGGKPKDTSSLPDHTSFQRKVKESILKGDGTYSAGGLILIEDINLVDRNYFGG